MDQVLRQNYIPPRKVLETLLNITKIILSTFIGNPHLHKPYAVGLNATTEREELIGVLAVEMDLNNVVETVQRWLSRLECLVHLQELFRQNSRHDFPI